MKVEYHKWYSQSLGRDMEYKTYGHDGYPLLAFPSQDGRYWDYADRGMIHALSPWIESGRLRVICCDGIDWETWSNFNGDPRWRIEQHERWFHYIVDELLPNVRFWEGQTFAVTGCSMGGFHAANFFFRRPDVFDTLISLSGLYHASYGFGGYSDELVYNNSPQDFLRQMPYDHPWCQMYRNRRIVLCVGQGRWEEELIDSTHVMEGILRDKDIPAWIDYWGHDCDHDWPWWTQQIAYFADKLF